MDEKAIKKKLTKEEYHVLREKGTEMPGSSKYLDFSKKGTYHCKVCGNELFSTKEQFGSSCGWPSFFSSKKDAVKKNWDFSHGMVRLEVNCKKCGSHLGHWFPDGPKFKRYCINGIALKKSLNKEKTK